MADAGIVVALDHDPIPHWRLALSSMSGSASLACWIVLLLPQLIEQWRTKSSDGISIGFLTAWLLGDITNLVGSMLGGLRMEVILLAVWYCFADSMIFASYFYYKHRSKLIEERRKHRRSSAEEPDPTAPLLARRNSAHRHHHRRDSRGRRDSLASVLSKEDGSTSVFTSIVLPIVFVLACGALGYFLSDAEPPSEPSEDMELLPQILGYISAALYLGARIPQIIRNHRRQSVEGLSLLFFILSVLGNVTYAGQILIYRVDRPWVMLYMSWLLGSLGTVFEDAIIFFQFYIYSRRRHQRGLSSVNEETIE